MVVKALGQAGTKGKASSVVGLQLVRHSVLWSAVCKPGNSRVEHVVMGASQSASSSAFVNPRPCIVLNHLL